MKSLKNIFAKKKGIETGLFIALLCVMLAIPSCKSHKKITDTTDQTTIPGSPLKYNIFNATKVVFTFVQNGSAMDVSGNIKIKKDSIVILSMQPFLGLEVARVVVTADEFLVIDRFNKRYSQIRMADVRQQLGMDINFGILQSMLTNSLFIIDKEGQAKVSDFKEANIGTLKLLQRTSGKVIQEFSVDSAYTVSSASIFADGEPYSLKWSYSSFSEIANNVRFPMQIKLTANNGSRTQQFDIKYGKIEIDKSTNFESNIPAGYKKVTVEELLGALK